MAYAIGIIHEENGVLGISFPDFPGAISTGASYDEVVRKGAQALALHIEGMVEDGEESPHLRSLDELHRQVPDAMADALVALIPANPPARSVRVNITLDEGLLGRIDEAAKAAGESRSAFLAEAAKDRIAR